jgi:hypothetical protein
VYYAIKREIPDMTIEQYLYVLETFKDVVRMRANVKKRGAYYFTCLRNCLWNPDQGYHVPTREEGYGQKENWAT